MTKKEAAEFQSLHKQLLEAKALRFTDPVIPDLPPPPPDASFGAMTRGWLFNASCLSVEKACSTSIYHGFGWERTSSQRPRALYSTEERAWMAMRNAVENECAKRLASIDAAIEKLRSTRPNA